MLLPGSTSPSHKKSTLSQQVSLGGGRYTLAVVGIICICIVIFNQSTSLLRNDSDVLKGNRKGLVTRTNLQQDKGGFPLPHLQSLVIVACHSVYIGTDFSHPEDQSSWALLDYQKLPGQTESFVQHIQLGVKEAAMDGKSLLLFSGGKTRKDAGPRAESMGYWMVAEANNWFGYKNVVKSRAFTEEKSRDSLENIIFSLCRFYELTGRYPEKITIVSYDFKEERFLETHRRAIQWPKNKMKFIGTPALNKEAIAGEEMTRNMFENDLYGCRGDLAKKRQLRDPFAHGGYTGDRCPDMATLLDYCPVRGHHVFRKSLPW